MLTVTGTCECVSYMGPALGGGHGWLQGQYGNIADQFLSLDIVLADGTFKTLKKSSDLWWAMGGAGHNFGIVTSVTSKIYDIKHRDWAIETLIFTSDKVEEVYATANEHFLRNQDEGVINWSYWVNNPDADPNNVSSSHTPGSFGFVTNLAACYSLLHYSGRCHCRRQRHHQTLPRHWACLSGTPLRRLQ